MSSWHTALKPQAYSVFVYNSSGSQSGNRFNSFSDLMTACDRVAGPKTVVIEQNETIPSGAYNFDYIKFQGNGLAYNAGGYTLTFGTGVTITSWTFGTVSSIRLLSTSSSAIWTTSGGFLLTITDQSELWGSSTDPFILNTGGGQCILYLGGAGRLIDNGYPAFETTASAFSCVIIVARQNSSTVDDDTLKSSNSVILGDFIQSTVIDGTLYPASHSGLTIGVDISAIQTSSSALGISSGANADFPNKTIFYSTDNANLVYKDSGGTIHDLY